MKFLSPSRFTLFSLEKLHLLIGFRGGIYSLTPELYAYLSGRDYPAEEQAAMEEELLLMDEREGSDLDIPSMPGRTLRALCLNITDDCNLNCIYCFTKDRLHDSKCYMKIETALKALDMLIERSDPSSVLQVDFFGGEPLLNLDLIKKVIDYAKTLPRKIKFTLTTNALLLSQEIIKYLNSENISLILSLDGDKKTQDINRRTVSGNSAWDTVITNIKNAVHSRDGENYYVRGTFTRENLDLTSIASCYVANGLNKFSLEPAKGRQEDSWAVTGEDTQYIKKEYEKLALYLHDVRQKGQKVDFFHFNVYLDTPLCSPRRLSGCGAGVEYLSVDPNGEIYPCHQLHFPEFFMGNINKNELFFEGMREKFEKNTIYAKEGCSECWARFYCSGGCHASFWMKNGSIDKADAQECELQKHRIKCAVWLEAIERIS